MYFLHLGIQFQRYTLGCLHSNRGWFHSQILSMSPLDMYCICDAGFWKKLIQWYLKKKKKAQKILPWRSFAIWNPTAQGSSRWRCMCEANLMTFRQIWQWAWHRGGYSTSQLFFALCLYIEVCSWKLCEKWFGKSKSNHSLNVPWEISI